VKTSIWSICLNEEYMFPKIPTILEKKTALWFDHVQGKLKKKQHRIRVGPAREQ
jgi:hypothetical protein